NLHLSTAAREQLTQQQKDDLALDDEEGLTQEEVERVRQAKEALEQAKKKVQPDVEKIWRGIGPMVEYITDHTNLYAVKPLAMFDVACLAATDVAGARVRYALGGGLQLTVVVAKFEVGYLRTLNRLPGDQRGNFVVRMVFEKLF